MQAKLTTSASANPGATPPAALRPRAESARPILPPSGRAAFAGRKTWARAYRHKLRVTDISIISASVLLSQMFRFGAIDNASVKFAGQSVDYWLISALIIGTWTFMIGAYRTRDSRVVGIGTSEYRRIVAASLLTFGLLAIIFFVFKVDIARGFFIVTFPLGILALLLSRWLWRKWLGQQRRFGHYLSSAIVVGRPREVEYVVRKLSTNTGAAYQVIGIATKRTDLKHFNVDGATIPVVADLGHVAEAARALLADVVIVAGQPSGGSDFIRNLGWDLERSSAELVLASRLTNVAGPRIHMRPVEGLPLMHVELPQFEGGKHVLKRAFDMIVAGLALIFFAPLMLTIAFLVRHDSPGGALFKQERVGRNGQPFRMLKFRSMTQDAEQALDGLLDLNEGAGGVLFKLHNDPRVTRIGRLLRKYSLDELPQLWNILVGDMSLVGPRPPLRREVDQYESHVGRRLFIKPGLTGMWQVNGRSNLSWEESVTLDLYYVENWSLLGDLVIMWRTLRAIKSPTGAY
jgi:exopolysaccharide biosynthesis polyprenyl glycosylphosphotransferase